MPKLRKVEPALAAYWAIEVAEARPVQRAIAGAIAAMEAEYQAALRRVQGQRRRVPLRSSIHDDLMWIGGRNRTDLPPPEPDDRRFRCEQCGSTAHAPSVSDPRTCVRCRRGSRHAAPGR
jgi:hypothetical protein